MSNHNPPYWHRPCICGHRLGYHNTDTGPCSKTDCDCKTFTDPKPPCLLCQKPESDSIHGPVDQCKDPSGGPCSEPRAHHMFS